jgi:hypothetical protein
MLNSLKCFGFFPKKAEFAPPILGIYSIQHRFNKYVYIGSSNDIRKRWAQHGKALLLGSHHNLLMQRDFNFYDKMPELFEYKIIRVYSRFIPAYLLHIIEQYYIDLYKVNYFLYNTGKPARINRFKRIIVMLINLID